MLLYSDLKNTHTKGTDHTVHIKNLGVFTYTAILRKVVGKSVHSIIPKGNMGYTVPDTVAVEPTFVAFL